MRPLAGKIVTRPWPFPAFLTRLVVFFLAVVVVSCRADPPRARDPLSPRGVAEPARTLRGSLRLPERGGPIGPVPVRALFLGNSLTAYNALPEMVDSLASASGLHFRSRMIAPGGAGLIDHYDTPSTRQVVAQGGNDVIILQQGPSTLPESRRLLLEWTRLWEPEILAAGARPAFYAVWPDKSRLAFFPDAHESYRQAAEAVNGLLFPVGNTWLETWELNPAAPLYGPDNFHPTITGSYVAAVVIVAVLSGRDPETLAPRFNLPPGIGAPPDSTLAATIRTAAARVLARQRGERPDPR